jgi:hypothetical protein
MLTAPSAQGGIVVYEKDDKKVEIGGRIQVQYTRLDPDEGETVDDLFFRRLRPYIQGTITKDWMGKIQFDFGKSLDDDEVAVKDAYLRYSGWKDLKLTIGNQKPPFSREFLTSSKRSTLVEKPFTGDHNFGNPDRMLGLRLDGNSSGKKFAYAASVGVEDHDPAVGRMDFDTPANSQSDWNEGWMAAGRVDIHPLGAMKYDQGDFGSDSVKFTISAAGFVWENDDDNNTFTEDGVAQDPDKADLDEATGFELSGGFRGHGLSFDAQYNMISGDTVDPDFTGGIYEDGSTDLDQFSFVAGYMVWDDNLEIVAGWESQDADGYEDQWTRTSVGFNYYINKHKLKLQFTHRFVDNVNGVDGDDLDGSFVQMQFVF